MILNLQEIFSKSIKLIVNNFSTLAPFILLFALTSLLGIWYNTTYPPSNLRPIPILVDMLFFSIISYIFTKTALKLAEGKAASLKDLNLSISEGIRFFVVGTLYFLLVLGGFLLLIIPGIYFSLKYFFAPILVLDNNLSIREVWGQAPKLTKERMLKLLPILLINILVVVATTILAVRFNLEYLSSLIDTIIQTVLFTVITVVLYLQFKGKKA